MYKWKCLHVKCSTYISKTKLYFILRIININKVLALTVISIPLRVKRKYYILKHNFFIFIYFLITIKDLIYLPNASNWCI